jgi:hypothetical protein
MTSDPNSREHLAWRAQLTRPYPVKNGPTLRTLKICGRSFSANRKLSKSAKYGNAPTNSCWLPPNVTATSVTEKVELALFLDARLLPVVTASLPAPGINAERARKLLARVRFGLSPGLGWRALDRRTGRLP